MKQRVIGKSKESGTIRGRATANHYEAYLLSLFTLSNHVSPPSIAMDTADKAYLLRVNA